MSSPRSTRGLTPPRYADNLVDTVARGLLPPRIWMLGVVAGALLVVPAHAQVNMPDPSLIHGKAIPAPELPTGTVTVRVVREAIGNNLAGQTVRVTTGSASRTDSTDEQGRAEFPNLVSGVEGRADVTVDGEMLVSDPFTVPASGGLRVILVAGLKQAAERRLKREAEEAAAPPVKGTVVFGGASRVIMEFRDDLLRVFYMLEVVNNARNRVDIGGPLTIQLPTGAGGAATMEGASPSVSVSGDVVTVQGPFAPGATPVNVGFVLSYTRPDVTIEQAWPAPTEQITVGIERIGSVNMTSPQLTGSRDVQVEDGSTYLLGNGPGLPANGTLTLHLSNLPVQSRTPVYVGVGLALAVMAFGAWLAFAGRTQDEDLRRRLIKRRDRLLGELARLEERRQREALDAKSDGRRQRLLTELEQIYGELDGVQTGPRGGGQGVAA
ncbi:MAG TPA: hypothetical protein VIX63_03725 [Vicinamibacterales bacterium]